MLNLTTPLHRVRKRLRGEEGFTLIELLVVIIIIGILAAIAIPSFLNQTSKAFDASAKELVHDAQIAAESYATDHDGSYAGLTPNILASYDATIQTSAGNGDAYIAANGVPTATSTGYKLTATSTNGDTFSITRTNGSIVRTCTGTGGGCAGGSW
jgi:type IV pilus assembly protein PilA